MENILELQPLILSLLILYTLLFVVQLFVYLYFYLKPLTIKNERQLRIQSENFKKPPVSVIICAKNEADNLAQNLPFFLEQDYPEYEVIVVNDCSTDGTDDLLEMMAKKYKHLRYTTIPSDEKFSHGKKLAITVGIKAAKYEWLLFSDADCKPLSNKWIDTMSRGFEGNNEIVLGYGKYASEKSFLNLLIRYEAFFIALQYISFALRKNPYMGVGRNLAYKKSLFFKNKGFSKHYHLPSGDDDLFINETATSENTTVELDKNSFTVSKPFNKLKFWIWQKRRHLKTSPYYSAKARFLVSLEPVSRVLFYICFIALLFFSSNKILLYTTLSIAVLRTLVYYLIMILGVKKFEEKKLLLISLVLDFILPYIYFTFMVANKISPKKQKWK